MVSTMAESVDKIIMKRLEAQRIKHGWTIAQMADKLHVSLRTYQTYKEEGCKNLSHNELFKISKELGCSIDYLYGIDEQEERQVADVCQATGLSAEAAKRLMLLNFISKHHAWGKDDDYAYTCRGFLGLVSHIIANIGNERPFKQYLLRASTKAFYKIIDTLPDSDRYRNELNAELDEMLLDEGYGRYLITAALNPVLESYEPQVPPCIYAASRQQTFGQKLNRYAEDKGKRYEEAYHRIKGLPEYELRLVDNKPTSVEVHKKPTAEDWALFKEITGLTEADLLNNKEGESNEKKQ